MSPKDDFKKLIIQAISELNFYKCDFKTKYSGSYQDAVHRLNYDDIHDDVSLRILTLKLKLIAEMLLSYESTTRKL